MAKKKVVKKNKVVIKPTKDKVFVGEEPKIKATNEFGLITEEKDIADEDYIQKIMNHFGYDRKRAAGYRYYTKGTKRVVPNFKEKELLELFKR